MKFPPKTALQQPAPSMTMIMVPEEEWRNLHDTLEQIIDQITRRNADDSGSEWIESEDARKILGVSPKTWQNYRDKAHHSLLADRPQNLRQPRRP